MNNNSLNILGQLRLMETRGYSAYEVAQLNGYTGTEQEWLESLVGPQGPQGPEGKSAYEVAVDNGYPGTEQEWIDSFLTPDGYYTKDESELLKTNILCSLYYRDCTEWINGITEETSSNPIKGYFQGMTTTENSIIFAVQAGGNYENKLNKVYLVEISKSTGNVLKEAFLELYHANSLAYNETKKEIYVACNSYLDENNQNVNFNKILIVDYSDFTIKGEANIASDVINNIGNSHIMSVSYDNKNKVLGIGTQNKFFIMDDFETVNRIINISYDNTAPFINPIFNNVTNQQIKLFDNKLYQTRLFGNGLIVRDLNGNVLKNYYSFETEIPLKIGEFEAIEIEKNGDIYISTVQRSWTKYRTYSLYDRTIFKSNIKVNGYKNYKKSSASSTAVNQYYVDSSTTNHLQIGTQNYPFKSINQAILTIQETEDLSASIYCTSLEKGLLINTCSKYISINGVQDYEFLGIVAQRCNLRIENAKIDLSNNLQLDNDNKNVQVDFSNVDFHSITFTGENSNDKIENCIYAYHSKLILSGCNFTNFINCVNLGAYTELAFGTNDNTLTNCDYKYYLRSQMVSIQENSRGIFNQSNPDGTLPNKANRGQFIDYTNSNNILTFNNPKVKDFISILSFAYNIKIGNTTVGLSDTFRMSNNRLTHIISISSDYYIIDLGVTFTDNNTKMQITPKVTQTDFNGNTSDITSSCTFNWYGLYTIN